MNNIKEMVESIANVQKVGYKQGYADGFNAGLQSAKDEFCESRGHNWDIMDNTGQGEDSYAYEYCLVCGKKSGK